MALTQPPPNMIDGWAATSSIDVGPLVRNQRIYQIGVINFNSGGARNVPLIYRSTDRFGSSSEAFWGQSGVDSWDEVGGAIDGSQAGSFPYGAPGTVPASIGNAVDFLAYGIQTDAQPNLITFMFYEDTAPGSKWSLIDFDLDTLTWSAQYGATGGPPVDLSGTQALKIIRLSDGSVVYFFFDVGGAVLKYSKYDALSTTWTLDQALGGFGGSFKCGVVDSVDTIHFIFVTTAAGPVHQNHYATLSASGTVSAAHDFPVTTDSTLAGVGGIYIGTDGNLHFCESYSPLGTIINSWVGTPYTAPSWSNVAAIDISAILVAVQFLTSVEIDGQDLIYVIGRPISGDPNILYSYPAAGGSGTLLYTPDTEGTQGNADYTPRSPNMLQNSAQVAQGCPDGAVIVLPMLFRFQGSGSTFTPVFFSGTACVPSGGTLTLTKVVSGTGAVAATNWTLSASGPTPISGPGGVGPSAVDAGTYDLSESAGPSGYTPDAAWVCTGGTQTGPATIEIAAGDVVVCTLRNTINRRPGTGFNPLPLPVPNIYADCLAWDYTNFRNIDRTSICRKRPDCATILEPEWVEAPVGAVQFNKSAPIPLPATTAVDVTVAALRVPFGYDGILTGHWHLFSRGFDEGSGDIVWRIRVNGRYLRDMGQMLFSMGSVRNLSPCPGGLWLLSGNLIEYIVSAPNAGGSLPMPGQGQVLAGLSGWFFPRM